MTDFVSTTLVGLEFSGLPMFPSVLLLKLLLKISYFRLF